MTARKMSLAASILIALAAVPALAAQIPYANFTGAGAVSNMTFLTSEGTGCTANCDGLDPVYGGHGAVIEGSNDVTFSWDGTLFTSSADYAGPGGGSNAAISAGDNLILGGTWTIHDVQIFSPGTYFFDASAGGDIYDNETGMLSMTVAPGQLGVHMLMDWSANKNIDIVNVWNISSAFSNCGSSVPDIATQNCLYTGNPNPAGNNASTLFLLASTDDDGDGTLGIPMAQGGPFYDANSGGFNFNFNLQGTMSVVPVPGAVWLFGSGLLGLMGVARRKKKN